MKKLNKIPSKEIIRYEEPEGYTHNNGYIFSDQLLFKRKTRSDRYREGKKQ